ncbi:MAG: hypothetical protein KBF96_07055 [Ignavibacteria bacterium]|nr:hypothetical protein [Ignavibacteria bacterium]
MNLCSNAHGYQSGISGERDILSGENSVEYNTAEEISGHVSLIISALNLKKHSIRHLPFAFIRKNSNQKNQDFAKSAKSNYSSEDRAACPDDQDYVDQSFLKYLRISKMLC